MEYAFHLEIPCTNNQARYEALIISLEILIELGLKRIEVEGNSQLVLSQLQGLYKCTAIDLLPYFAVVTQLLDQFDEVQMTHIPRKKNEEANHMA